VDDQTPQLGIALEPEYRGKGYGRRLMLAALEAARRHGYRQVSLTVHPQNPAAALYKQCGFEDREIRKTYHLMLGPAVTAPQSSLAATDCEGEFGVAGTAFQSTVEWSSRCVVAAGVAAWTPLKASPLK
jgi:hypothetical protein